MKRYFRMFSIMITMLFLVILSGCNKDSNTTDPTVPTNKIETGSVIDVSTTSVGSAGSNIVISKPGTPIDKMEIQIPANSFSTTKSFKISYAEITSHQFGADFNPITPLIRIDYGGGYSDSVMTIKLPAIVPQGHFAMGFYYDAETGELEGLPIVAINDNEIILATRHFSGKHLSDGKLLSKNKNGSIFGSNTYVDILAASIETAKLFQMKQSGFHPSIDDWEFPNKGSYIATNGHCAGQTVTSMWYYSMRKLAQNQPSLYGRFETIPGNLWQDNPMGYRLASTVQRDIFAVEQWSPWLQNFNNIGTKRFSKDSLNYLAFAYAIHITKKPQLAYIKNNFGDAHAMVCYQTNLNVLSIADPNYPGSYSRLISLGTDGKFIPYESKEILFPNIRYIAKSAMFSFEKMGQRWAEFDAKIIGNDVFPKYTLWVDDVVDYELKDGITIAADTLVLYCKSTECESFIGTDHYQSVNAYNSIGNFIAVIDATGKIKIPLISGQNKIGLYIKGGKDTSWYYLDFVWMNMYYQYLKISPNPISAKTGDTIKVTCNTNGTAPAQAKYVWTFGDGTAQVTKQNDSTVTHTYTNQGSYIVKVELYNNATNTKIVETTVPAQITTASTTGSPCPGTPTVTYAGKTYNTVLIGSQCWLKENLDVGTMIQCIANQTDNGIIEKYCYDNNTSNCDTYGGLYKWNEAMQYVTTAGAKGICPTGWHIPTTTEFTTLKTSVNNDGNALKSVGQETGTNTSGFSALLAGHRMDVYGGTSSSLGSWANFWNSKEVNSGWASSLWLQTGTSYMTLYSYTKDYGFSVRCVKD